MDRCMMDRSIHSFIREKGGQGETGDGKEERTDQSNQINAILLFFRNRNPDTFLSVNAVIFLR